jgi:hypothetical protein
MVWIVVPLAYFMGYTLKIGEAVIRWDRESVKIDCGITRNGDAPAFGEPTDYESQRWPSYTSWCLVIKALGMSHVMFDSRNGGPGEFEKNGKTCYPLICQHPGAMPITIEHAEEVEACLTAYKAAHPGHTAQYPPPKPGAKPLIDGSDFYKEEDLSDDPTYDGNLVRGEWLAYWLRWAVENCNQPVFVNS